MVDVVGMSSWRSKLRWSIAKRLQFIEFRLFWEGRINRRDLVQAFGISAQQASADLARYETEAPGNMAFDSRAKCYYRTRNFRQRLIEPDATAYLTDLATPGDADTRIHWIGKAPPIATFSPTPRCIEATILRSIIEAIRKNETLSVRYQSMSREQPSQRSISPHALGYDGQQWHTRAWCHTRQQFRNFSLSRIISARRTTTSNIDPLTDCEWRETIDLEIIPGPTLSPAQRKAVEIEYGMKSGRLFITVRRSFIIYALRRLGLDIPEELRPKSARRLKLVDRARIAAITGLSSSFTDGDHVEETTASVPLSSPRRPRRRR
jgi:hypothetical protein